MEQGVIECPNPDKDIRRFDANIRLFPPFLDNDLCPLTINNTLLQSCYLRNTEWACGVAVYTGAFLCLSPTLYKFNSFGRNYLCCCFKRVSEIIYHVLYVVCSFAACDISHM